MSPISRRDLISSGLALSTATLVTRSAWARTAALLAGAPDAATATALAPREQLLFDFGWKFELGNGVDPARDHGFGTSQDDFSKTGDFKFAKVGYDDSKWRSLNLPHDWAVELPFVWDDTLASHGFKPLGRRYPETSVGWYRREFDIPASDAGRRVAVEFDGAFRDVFIFVNGCFIGRNDNGYAPFRFDITDFLAVGQKNCIVARVDASFGDGWFYEGAGIYRHVWLTKTDALHLGKWESYVRPKATDGEAVNLELATVVVNEGKNFEKAAVSWQILDAAGKTVATAEAPAQVRGPCDVDLSKNVSFAASAHIEQSNAVVRRNAQPLHRDCDRQIRRQGSRRRAHHVWRAEREVRRRSWILSEWTAA